MREYHYSVDRDGRVFHDDTEIVDAAVLRFFLLAMQRTPDDRYLVVCQGEQNWFRAADTPFVIQRLRADADNGRLRAIDLVLAGNYRERLDPASLEIENDQLFCRVRRGAFQARFGRIAMQQLAPYLRESEGGLILLLDGATYQIRQR